MEELGSFCQAANESHESRRMKRNSFDSCDSLANSFQRPVEWLGMGERSDGRGHDELRPVTIQPDWTKHAEGSVLIECGHTRVLCTASVEDKVPHFLRGSGKGWVTAEYGMLPRSTGTRMTREVARGRPSGRTQEIQRLIGRALRSVVRLNALGERTIWVDCDVLQADGGTRTASITGAFVALGLAGERLRRDGALETSVLFDYVGAVSVGVVAGEALLDLNYEEDFQAQVDMNIVMSGKDQYVEVQGTAEESTFSRNKLDELLDLARDGILELRRHQKEALQSVFGDLDNFLLSLDAAFGSGHNK